MRVERGLRVVGARVFRRQFQRLVGVVVRLRPAARVSVLKRAKYPLNGLRRDEEALAAYYRAMAALRSLKESPDYLFARMHEVQMRLEASGAKKELAR